MANELKLTFFIYPGCIEVCNGGAKFVNGNLPVIARIYPDRTVVWERKRISEQMKSFVSDITNEPFIAIPYSQQENFFQKTN